MGGSRPWSHIHQSRVFLWLKLFSESKEKMLSPTTKEMKAPGSASMSSAPKGKKYPRSRHYVFTSFDEGYLDLLRRSDLSDDPVRYLSAQIEVCPESGKDHVQGYVEFYEPLRLTGAKKVLRSKTVHLEVRAGTRDQARDYSLKTTDTLEQYPKWKGHGVRKVGTEPYEFGKWDSKMKSGRRSDLERMWQMIREGATEYEVLETYPKSYMMYTRGLRNARQMYLARNQAHFRQVTVRVNWGDAGTGKTRHAYDSYDPNEVYELASLDPLWFDGYSGQKVLLINEFYGQLKPSQLLKLLDGYRTQYPVKGGFITAEWDTVIVTSNVHPKEWYSERVPNEVKRAIARRIDVVEHFVREQARDDDDDPWASVVQTERVVDVLGATVATRPYEDSPRCVFDSPKSEVAVTGGLVLPATSFHCSRTVEQEPDRALSLPSCFAPGTTRWQAKDASPSKGRPKVCLRNKKISSLV